MRLNSHDNTANDYRRARSLRNNASPIENKLWSVLRKAAKTKNLKFRRQQSVHPFIADFACMEARLLIELDGDTHAASKKYDSARDEKLQKMGFSILRFTNDDVVQNVEGVADTIILYTIELIKMGRDNSYPPLPDPPREGEGR